MPVGDQEKAAEYHLLPTTAATLNTFLLTNRFVRELHTL